MNPQRQRLRRADAGVDAKPHRIEPQQCLLVHAASTRQVDQDRHYRADDHIPRILHPEDRCIDQQVAQRPAPHARDRREEDEGHDVLPLVSSHERPRRGEHRDARIIEDGKRADFHARYTARIASRGNR
jgi:hypothetical protein